MVTIITQLCSNVLYRRILPFSNFIDGELKSITLNFFEAHLGNVRIKTQ